MSARDRAGFDEEPIPFGEAFGINPDGSPYEPPQPDPEPEPEPQPEPEPEPAEAVAQGDVPDVPDVPATGGEEEREPTEWEKRGFDAGDFTEKGWRTYRELETRFSQTRPSEPTLEAETEPQRPSPLLKGEVGEIKTEADLYNWATADPARAALWAMENHEALDPEQLNNVMDNWLAREPWKAISHISAWNLQMARDEFSERQAIQDAHYMDTMRDRAIAEAEAEQPLLVTYKAELGQYIEQNPKLLQMVDAARTAAELKQALHGIFYMFAGPRLQQQLLEAQVSQKVAAEAAAKAAEQADNGTQRATSMSRNTAPAPSDSDTLDDAIRNKILQSKR